MRASRVPPPRRGWMCRSVPIAPSRVPRVGSGGAFGHPRHGRTRTPSGARTDMTRYYGHGIETADLVVAIESGDSWRNGFPEKGGAPASGPPADFSPWIRPIVRSCSEERFTTCRHGVSRIDTRSESSSKF